MIQSTIFKTVSISNQQYSFEVVIIKIYFSFKTQVTLSALQFYTFHQEHHSLLDVCKFRVTRITYIFDNYSHTYIKLQYQQSKIRNESLTSH